VVASTALVTSLVPPPIKLLIVEDEPGLRKMLEILFRREGYTVVTAAGCKLALEAIQQHPQPFPAVLTDLAMPDGSGLEVIAGAKARSPSTEVILLTAHGTVENAIAAMRSGAYDFVAKPFDSAELVALVTKALEKQAIVAENARLRAQVDAAVDQELLGKSAAMRAVFDLIDRIARAHHGAHHRRERHGQGARGSRHPQTLGPQRRTLHGGQLRRAARGADGE
jgi:two-component system, NtrC family, response regulator PilR